MIKFFLKDILVYLEKIEEVAEQKHKINDYDSVINELEIARAKIKDKIANEHKLKNECDILQQENCLLKLKIDSLNYKLKNMNNLSIYSSNGPSPTRKKINNINYSIEKHSKSKNHYMSPKFDNSRNLFVSSIDNSYFNRSSLSSIYSPKQTELNNSAQNKKNIDKLTLKLNYDKAIKSKKNFKYKDKVKITKFVNNRAIIKVFSSEKNKNKNKNYNSRKYNIKIDNYETNTRPVINKIKIKKNKNPHLSAEKIDTNYNNKNKYSPINTINQTIAIPSTTNNNNINNIDYQNLEKNIINIIDCELKEIEKDQSNIELLLEQLNEYNTKK